MSPVDPAGPLTGTNFQNFTLGSCEKFHPDFRNEKRPKTGCSSTREEQSKHAKHKVTFAPVIALATLIAESLLLNGMLMMWKVEQAKQNDVELIQSKNSSRFYPGNRAQVFINFQPSYRNSGWKNGRDIGNRASPPSHEHIENLRKKFRGKARSRKLGSYQMKRM